VCVCVFACKWDLLENKRNTSISAIDASDRFFNQNVGDTGGITFLPKEGNEFIHSVDES
jgi:hypothetical protein